MLAKVKRLSRKWEAAALPPTGQPVVWAVLAGARKTDARDASMGMILIGQYDSPFVRRVAIALRLYAMPFEHRPWSTYGDADRIAPFNPLRRVPTLVLDDGETLIESAVILDHLDELAGPGRALIAARGPERRRALKVCALATGLADKAVSLFYERTFHPQASQVWTDRCRAQIGDALAALESARTGRDDPFWFGPQIGHADIALACALRFLGEAHPGLYDIARWPALAAHSERCELLPVFREIAQPFLPPAR
ncbi:MAG TPA: glutathione S-transferase family protein [Geminicoccaceae bacterium]|jgi:glutathione S-transferase|nr:glutathione S-transferase family protein [Geminicoccaceae bacterium]